MNQSPLEKEVASLIEKARKAQELVAHYTQEQIDEVCIAIGWEVYNDENIKELANMAVNETGMGNVSDKIAKHKGKVLGVLKDIKGALSTGLIEKDEAKGIEKYAKPVGVVGALTPVTNPTATPASNAVTILKGRNAVIFAPHPKSKNSSTRAVEMMRNGLEKVGAPKDLIQIIATPSIDKTAELMKQVDLVLATGGGAMVKAAYSSGTPSYGVGPGNSVQIIAEDANIEDATSKIVLSKCFDNATSCSSENSVIIESNIYERALALFKEKGGYLCEGNEREALEEWMWVENKHGIRSINPQIIAKSAIEIAKGAQIDVPSNCKMLIVEGIEPILEDRFALEKLSPVLTLWKYNTFDDAYRILKELTDNCGTGHSCGIHTFTDSYITLLGEKMNTSRIMVNQPQAPANGGNFFNGMPSTVTLGCGTWGGNITTENINYKHFLNITWVSRPITPVKPTDDEMFGSYLKKIGVTTK
jgi:sulfoacetaldehyde dehydrogenase